MRTTRPSDLQFKVINAVINTLRDLDSVAYVSGGNGGSGFGLFSPSDDFQILRKQLWDFDLCEDIDVDDEDFGTLFNDWAEYEEFDSSFDFYELSNCKGLRLQVMVNPNNYVNSHELRDMITEDYPELSDVETTQGRNGYPRNLRGAVIGFSSWDQAAQISDLYGAEVVALRKRDGWQFYEVCGSIYEDFNLAEVYADDPNYTVFHSLADFIEFIEERMSELDADDDEDGTLPELQCLRDELNALPDLSGDQFVLVPYSPKDYEILNSSVAHYSEDVWTHDIALDCTINN